MLNKTINIVIRLFFTTIIILTSFYSLLAYPPFTYQQVIKLEELVTWLALFVKIQPYLYLISSISLIPVLLFSLEDNKLKRISQVFVFANLCFSIALIFNPLLEHLENTFKSLFWCFITSLPLFCLIIIDYLNYFPKIVWPQKIDTKEDKRIFLALLKTSVFVPLLYFAIFQARSNVDFYPTVTQKIFILFWSFSTHLVMFMAIFAIFNLIRALARFSLKTVALEFWLLQITAVIFLSLVFEKLIFAAIGFNNYLATVFALIFSILLVAFFSNLSVLLSVDNKELETTLSILLKPFFYKNSLGKTSKIFTLVVLVTTTYLLTIKFVALDWDFLLQKLIALAVWLFVFTFFYSNKFAYTEKLPKVNLMLLFCLLSLINYKIVSVLEKTNKNLSSSQLIEKYIGYDASARLLKEIFTPPKTDSSFYKFLQNSSNIAQEKQVKPVKIDLVENLSNQEKEKPNIFIFTIDSLRQDYLGAYNSSVAFTPFIDDFASKSIVMEKAFTHYGGTGLSEPSIWVGGMLLHKQYVTPFYSMNTLEKLLKVENYQNFISVDSILETIIKPSTATNQMDKGTRTQSLKFCKSLDELKNKVLKRQDKRQPIFAYTQPQDIHISVINRENRSILDKGNYANFYAPYASRVKNIDKCFGDFINFLKSEGLFENSIIIFTADHGDSLGEEGRFGHAYTIFPEILKIPLIIHLPENLKSSLTWDTKTIAFSSDITPSLYYLLGYKPTLKNKLFGRPLFTATIEEQKVYLQDYYLVTSSYGAVYGLLSKDAASLYIADAVNFQDYYYDLTNDPKGTINQVNSLIKKENEQLIRKHVEEINNFYKFKLD